MDAADALADLAGTSAQIEALVLATLQGDVVASTFADDDKGARVARAAAELLRAAEETRSDGARLSHLEAALPAGSVFVVRDDERVLTAVTVRDPTSGLVFYDLKASLRLLAEEKARTGGEERSEASAGGASDA